MTNSKSSELKQIVQGNILPNVYVSEEEHVQMFSGACPRHVAKVILRAMLTVPLAGKLGMTATFGKPHRKT